MPRGKAGTPVGDTGVELLAGEIKKGETVEQVIGCNDYLRLGLARSIRALKATYRRRAEFAKSEGMECADVPTLREGTLEYWCSHYEWVARAAIYDAEMDKVKSALNEEYVMRGLAKPLHRVNELVNLYDLLSGELHLKLENGTMPNLWCEDVKEVGNAVYTIKRFNAGLVAQLRGVLDDIAKETGGRRQITELSGKNGGPLQMQNVNEPERLTRAQLEWIAVHNTIEGYIEPKQGG